MGTAFVKVGIDVNVKNLFTDSFGGVVENPRFYQKQLQRLQREQRKRAARAKQEHRPLTAKNYQKPRKVVAALHRHIYNQRQSFLHLIFTALIKNHDLVVAEKLQGKNPLNNHALAPRPQDVGWSILFENLAYKAELFCVSRSKIDDANLSPVWLCNGACWHAQVDLDAAINILNKAVA